MGLEELQQNQAKYRCDRCGFEDLVEEFIEDPASPGLFVHKDKHKCADKIGFDEAKSENPRESYGNNYFQT